ncbi:MAG: MFS transporter [Proteobacteria bacterium]|nr:MFS transporter [Pseudomonadota bacterium]
MTMPTQGETAQTVFEDHVKRNLRRNYAVNLLYGLFGTTGFRLFFAPTFVPKYIKTLSGSNIVVGLLQAVGSLMHIITLIFAVRIAETDRLRNRVVVIGLSMRVQILLMALAGFFLGNRLNLIMFFIFYALFNLLIGIQNVVYNMIMSKIIPIDIRGTFVGIRDFLGGFTAWLVARQASVMIADIPFPQSYAWIFLTAFVLTTTGLCFFAASREPAAPSAYAPTPPILKLFGEMKTMLRLDPSFRNFVIVRALSSASMIGMPYYILYATDSLNLHFSDVADITTYLFITETLFTLVWGRLADRFGFRAVFLLGLLFMTSAIALLIFVAPTLILIRLVFALVGAGMGGFMIGSNNMVLEFGTMEDRPRRIVVAAIAGDIMRGVAPLFGGFVADTCGYLQVFWLGLALLLISVAVLYRLVEEPRHSASLGN